MLKIRKRDQIYSIDGGWFQGQWHFSFDQYCDPENVHFGTLRVFNVDTIIPGGVWPMHPHRDIEVVTYCADGVFEHGDNMGNGGLLYPGDVQHTTVGTGVYHTEINHSQTEPMTFVQMWFMPREPGLEPRVEQKHVQEEERRNRLLPVVSNRHDGALPIQQDVEVYASSLEAGKEVRCTLAPGQGGYLYVISGKLETNGGEVAARDAARITEEEALSLHAVENTHLLLVLVEV